MLMKKVMASQMKGVPQAEQDRIFSMIENNPDFFENIAKETQELVKKGKDQQTAAMEVMRKYQGDLQKIANQTK
jgi:hypothetical protein